MAGYPARRTSPGGADNIKITIVSTYPPRPCGIGTFSADLRGALLEADPLLDVEVVPLVAASSAPVEVTDEVAMPIRQHVRADYPAAARRIDAGGTDVVLIEHEYGIFGGRAGAYVIDLVAALRAPVVVTLHTVLSTPDPAQASTLQALCRAATLVTVFTETARRMVLDAGIVTDERIRVVPHGAPPLIVARELAPTADGLSVIGASREIGLRTASTDLTLRRLGGRTVLSTFGLISAGKGIETALAAVAQVVPQHPDVLYLVAGQTHPEVVRHDGEAYRHQLETQVRELGLEHHVQFLDRFLELDELAMLLSSTDLYLTPYRSREQIVSGALTFAVAAGCPVVSTPYYYAEDLLRSGAGVLVPFDDPAAMAGAITRLLDRPADLAAARRESARIGGQLSWTSVGRSTLTVLDQARRAGRPATRSSGVLNVRLDHLLGLTDDVGIIQHADGVAPRWSSGYCVDDVARLVLVVLGLGDRLPREVSSRLLRSGLGFLAHAWDPEGPGLHNFLGHDRRWSDTAGVGDHVGRAVWALGSVFAADPPTGGARPALRQLEAMEPFLQELRSPRAMAFVLLGLTTAPPTRWPDSLRALVRLLTDRLVDCLGDHVHDTWRWFEPYLTYDNARLAQALIAAGDWLGEPEIVHRGLSALDWYLEQCGLETGELRLVGNGWRQREVDPLVPLGDEQPLDAAAAVEAAVEAYRVTGREAYATHARNAFGWFLGHNAWGLPVYDAASGGSHDGLGPDGLNDNEGAESTLAFWQALLALGDAGLAAYEVDVETDRR